MSLISRVRNLYCGLIVSAKHREFAAIREVANTMRDEMSKEQSDLTNAAINAAQLSSGLSREQQAFNASRQAFNDSQLGSSLSREQQALATLDAHLQALRERERALRQQLHDVQQNATLQQAQLIQENALRYAELIRAGPFVIGRVAIDQPLAPTPKPSAAPATAPAAHLEDMTRGERPRRRILKSE